LHISCFIASLETNTTCLQLLKEMVAMDQAGLMNVWAAWEFVVDQNACNIFLQAALLPTLCYAWALMGCVVQC